MDNYTLKKDSPTCLESQLLEDKIKDLLPKDSTTKLPPINQTGGLGDVCKGILGCQTTIYEIQSEGAVVCTQANLLKGYFFDIYLIGFNPASEFYQDLKRKLEALSKNPSVVLDELPEDKRKILETFSKNL